MLFSGILTAVGLVAIAAKFSPTFLKKILGYDWIIDLVVTFGIPIFMGGSHIGIMTGVITGLSISLILYIAKNIMGYQKLEKGSGFMGLSWVTKPGKWTPAYIGSSLHSAAKSSIKDAASEFKQGWDSAANVEDAEIILVGES